MVECPNCNVDINDNVSFCPNCGFQLMGKKIICKECGAHINEGSVFCNKCGAEVPKELELTSYDEELKLKEIQRLVEVNNKRFVSAKKREPQLGLFTEDEILKYAPNSAQARRIRTKNANGIIEKIKVNEILQMILLCVLMGGAIIVITIITSIIY